MDANYPNYFQSISEKIKYFHAGFHSTTPEGLNTRLTFLQQCMRQGPSIYDDNSTIQPQNLAFGRPPICILRVGDFFYTKIAINSLNITYTNGSGVQWDLNPEGIGVQPMVANITLGINIIGGQSLVGPINRLQNALSFNYYANTEMYDVRSDSIDKSTGKIVPGLKLGQIKQEAGVDINKLSESLKTEGIIAELTEAEKTANNTQTDSQGGIDIKANGEIITILSKKEPANVEIGGAKQKDNLLAVSIKVERKGIGYKETYFEEKRDQTISVGIDEWGKGVINEKEIANLKTREGERDEKLIEIANLEDQIALSGNTISNFPDALAELKQLERELKDIEKDIKKLSNGNNKVKVEAYYTKDKKGSRTPGEFTYGSAGLTS